MKWREYEFIFVLCLIFGAWISLSNSSSFINFPNNMTSVAWFGLMLFIAGLIGIYDAEK
jgi:hypothetical protein